jgi:hypothetical protein
MQTNPKRRNRGLIIREIDDEILIYNNETDKAYCLNETAALIWRACDGLSSPKQISNSLTSLLGARVDERIVWFALKQFKKDDLLENSVILPDHLSAAGLSRRQMVHVLGVAALVAVPVVTSLIAPTPAQASTCLPAGQHCTASIQCCTGLCVGNTCS